MNKQMAGFHKSMPPGNQESCMQLQVISSVVGADAAAASGNQESE